MYWFIDAKTNLNSFKFFGIGKSFIAFDLSNKRYDSCFRDFESQPFDFFLKEFAFCPFDREVIFV